MSLPKALFEEISAKVGEVVQSNPVKDLEKNIKAMVSATLNKMNLVTRDEFAVQQKMLQKALTRLALLEEAVQNKKPAASATPKSAVKASEKKKPAASKTDGAKKPS